MCSCWFECVNPSVCSCWFECVNPSVCSSVVERCPDKTEVEGPIPSTRTAGEFPCPAQGFLSLLVLWKITKK